MVAEHGGHLGRPLQLVQVVPLGMGCMGQGVVLVVPGHVGQHLLVLVRVLAIGPEAMRRPLWYLPLRHG